VQKKGKEKLRGEYPSPEKGKFPKKKKRKKNSKRGNKSVRETESFVCNGEDGKGFVLIWRIISVKLGCLTIKKEGGWRKG